VHFEHIIILVQIAKGAYSSLLTVLINCNNFYKRISTAL